MRRAGTSAKEAGFTLLELLIAITILSLILVTLSGGVHFAGRAWRHQEEQIGRRGDINAVQTVLRQLVASGRDFEGSAQDLKFVGQMPAALARGGVYDIELREGADVLLLSWRPHFKGPSAALSQNETALLDGVQSLDIAYYSTGKGWQPALSDKSKSIDLIAIRTQLSDRRAWPSLMISPAINVSSKAKS